MTEYITIEPNWEGMRRWVREVFKTDPEVARDIAEAMGSEAPDLDEEERSGNDDRT